jgi:2-furoyl-CoA dehydrogenase large subunit
LQTDHGRWVGKSVERVEDAALLTGRGCYIDDLGIKPGTLEAAVLRSPHAHADIISIDTDAARALPGIAAVITGADLANITASLVASVRAPIDARPIAVDRVRYVGEPVAVVVATDRYVAEDAFDLIEVSYRLRPAVVNPLAALVPDAPVLHEAVGSNLISDRRFCYGDPDAAFAAAARRIAVSTHYPRNTGSPIETYGVVAEYAPHEDAYDIMTNFQGPFSLHAVAARALKVP